MSSLQSGRNSNREVIDKYQLMDILGEGTYGVVYRAVDRRTSDVVALKKIRLDRSEEGIPQTALREVSILQELQHTNVVNLRDVICVQDAKLYLVFEYVEQDLKKALEKRISSFSATLLKRLMWQLLDGLCFCHSHRILHRDLKPANILLTTDNTLKIADFGLARSMHIPTNTFTHEVVTLWYRAPEILLGEKHYTAAVDMWSVGCIFAELARRKVLFRGDSEVGQLMEIFQILGTPTESLWSGVTALPDFKDSFPRWSKASLDKVVPTLDAHGIDLLQRLLKYEPNERISAKAAMQHPYFDDVRDVFTRGAE